MGYASYFEDIRDKIAENLNQIGHEIVEIESTISVREKERLESLIDSIRSVQKRTETLLNEINEDLELASNPDFDATFEVIQARERISQLEQRPTKKEVDELRAKNKQLAQNFIEKKLKIDQLSQKLTNVLEESKKIQKENKKLRSQIEAQEEVTKERKREIYEKHLDPKKIRDLKPNEFKRR